MSMHADQLPITEESVRHLVTEQFPEWASHKVEHLLCEGTTNAIFRIGPNLVARFPLREIDPELALAALEAEADAARELSGHTSFPVPRPVALGSPGAGFPLPWLVLTWLPGTSATTDDPGGSLAFARDLATFISEVRSIDTKERVFSGGRRGGDLPDHDEWMNFCFEESDNLLDVAPLRRSWLRYRELPDHTGDTMTHGDLIPGNVLVSGGRLSGILDVASYGPADPALDLVSAWHILDTGPRATLRSVLQCTDLQWERGKAWAFQQAMGLVWYYEHSNPSMSRFGRRTLERLAADERLRS